MYDTFRQSVNSRARGGTHSQLGKLLALLSSAGHVGIDLRSDEGRYVEFEMRRIFGKCIRGSGSKSEDLRSSVKQALRRLVLAGGDLLQAAQA